MTISHTASPHTPPKVLIVDDDKTYQRILQKTFESIGLTTTSCMNGRIAFEVLDDNRDISLVVSDIMMEEMDGKELALQIRSEKHFTDLPIILISGIVNECDLLSLVRTSLVRFLRKPLAANEIKLKATELLQRTAYRNDSIEYWLSSREVPYDIPSSNPIIEGRNGS